MLKSAPVALASLALTFAACGALPPEEREEGREDRFGSLLPSEPWEVGPGEAASPDEQDATEAPQQAEEGELPTVAKPVLEGLFGPAGRVDASAELIEHYGWEHSFELVAPGEGDLKGMLVVDFTAPLAEIGGPGTEHRFPSDDGLVKAYLCALDVQRGLVWDEYEVTGTIVVEEEGPSVLAYRFFVDADDGESYGEARFVRPFPSGEDFWE